MMKHIQYETQGGVGTITLNKPEKRNALDARMIEALTEAFRQADEDASVRVILFKAMGSTFCSGMDLAYIRDMQHFSYKENLADSEKFRKLIAGMEKVGKPVVARVQGTALAGGCGLVTMCDFAFSVPHAKFGYTEVKIGFLPAIVMVPLVRKVGEKHAQELLLSGDIIEAEEAHSKGLIYQCVAKEELDQAVDRFIQALLKNNASISMNGVKKMIRHMRGMSFEDALIYAVGQNARARGTADCQKGIRSFLNKEKPDWSQA